MAFKGFNSKVFTNILPIVYLYSLTVCPLELILPYKNFAKRKILGQIFCPSTDTVYLNIYVNTKVEILPKGTMYTKIR